MALEDSGEQGWMSSPQIASQVSVNFQTDVVRAKTELGKHVSELIMHPQADTGSYVVEGEWDLLGDCFSNARATSRTEGLYVGMVPGARTVPNAPRVFFNLQIRKK